MPSQVRILSSPPFLPVGFQYCDIESGEITMMPKLIPPRHRWKFQLANWTTETMKKLLSACVILTVVFCIVSGCDKPPSMPPTLFEAAETGDVVRVKALLAEGAYVNEKVVSPLHVAAENGHKEIVEVLLAHGADVNAKDYNGWTPLHYAVFKGHKEVVEMLLAHGADVNARNTVRDYVRNMGDTSLHMAASGGYKEIAEALLTHGAYANAKNEAGRTPLDEAESKGYKEIVGVIQYYLAEAKRTGSPTELPQETIDSSKNKSKANLAAIAQSGADHYDAILTTYGKPERDDSTEYDDPQPQVVTRILEYRPENVKVALVVNAQLGDPPPYASWKIFGCIDMNTNTKMSIEEATRRLQGRLK